MIEFAHETTNPNW